MEMVQIKNDNEKIVLYIEDNKYWGNIFYNDGRIEPINNNIFNYFKLFLLSNNQTRLPDVNNYQVILDNDTNFKHYFINGKEDFSMLFFNNGEDALMYSDDEKGFKKTVKRFKTKFGEIVVTLGSLLMSLAILSLLVANVPDYPVVRDVTRVYANEIVNPSDLSVNQIIEMINNSPNLQPKEKEFLGNIKYFEDMLEYINESDFTKYMYGKKFDKIVIKREDPNSNSNYNQLLPNELNVSGYDYDRFEDFRDDIAHEYMHLGQLGYEEANAELLSSEYFEGCQVDSYNEHVLLVCKLMEIIGPEPLLKFNYGDDFSSIEENVKPYLSSGEYSEFYSLFHSKRTDVKDSASEKKRKNTRLLELISTIYHNKYGRDINEDEAMIAIDSPWHSRYYFNGDFMDQEHSYYYKVYKIVPYEENSHTINPVDYIKDDVEYQKLLIDRFISDGGEIDLSSKYPSFMQALTEDDYAFMNDGIYFRGEKVELEPINVKFPNQVKGGIVWHQ